jgi:hypothetical protein
LQKTRRKPVLLRPRGPERVDPLQLNSSAAGELADRREGDCATAKFTGSAAIKTTNERAVTTARMPRGFASCPRSSVAREAR